MVEGKPVIPIPDFNVSAQVSAKAETWYSASTPGAATAAPGFLKFTAPRAERPGRGADDGYSFVSMIHHTARGKARPVMG